MAGDQGGKSMTITTRIASGVTVFRPEGPRLVYAVLDSFVEQVHQRLPEEAPRVVLDFSAVNYVDSAAIGCLMDLYRRVTDRGGRIMLAGLEDRVARMLRMTGAHEFMTIHDTVENGVEALAEQGAR